MGQEAGAGSGGRDRRASRFGWLDRLPGWARGRPAQDDARCSAELTTLPAPGRGQALRAAHRTLRQHLRSHPAIRQVLPHLSAIERALARRGSIALLRLPVPVLQRGLQQLALLQREDEDPQEAAHLRVLRLRLIEAIEWRGQPAPKPGPGTSHLPTSAFESGFSSTRGAVQSSLPPATSTLPSVAVSELPSSGFGTVDGPGARRAHPLAGAGRRTPR